MKKYLALLLAALLIISMAGCNQSLNNARKETQPQTTSATPSQTTPTVPESPQATAPATTQPEATEPFMLAPPANPAVVEGYWDVYAEICQLLDSGDIEKEYRFVGIGLIEVADYVHSAADRYKTIAYAVTELDNDGCAEMVVVDAANHSQIFAVYTLFHGKPVLAREGYIKAPLYYLSSGQFYRTGSVGATGPYFETDTECWFIQPKDPLNPVPCYYYATNHDLDPSTAQEITAQEYESKKAELTEQIVVFNAQPFADPT